MALELLANNAASTLNAGIDSSQTTLVVASATGFPTTGNFRIKIDSEYMLVTGVSGTTFTVTRAIESSTGASHSSGASVDHILTKAGVEEYLADRVATGTLSSLPTAGIKGRLYHPTDAPYLYRDTGSVWEAWGPHYKFTPVIDANYSWVNQGAATLSMANGVARLSAAGTGTGSDNFIMRVKTVPTAPYTVTMAFMPTFGEGGYNGAGLILRESGSGKFATLGVAWRLGGVTWSGTATANQSLHLHLDKYNSATSYNSSYIQKGYSQFGALHWMRLVDTNTNREYYLSGDGYTWSKVGTIGRTDYITPNQIGFYIGTLAETYSTVGCTVYHWLEQ